MRPIPFAFSIFCAITAGSAESLLLLPIAGGTDNAADLATINRLYRDAVEADFQGKVLPASDVGQNCADHDCLVAAGRQTGADVVVSSTFSRLGSKWVFSSTLLKTDGSSTFKQHLAVSSIEEMEPATQRMADALLKGKTIEQAASVDNLTQKEETQEPERRISLYSSGLGVGYIFPGSRADFNDTLINSNSSYTPIIRLAWLNNWQFNNNLLLNTDLLWGVGAELGGDANLDYLFNRSDYAPFIGGGLGLHYVYSDKTGRSSGFALNGQGGMMLFRTYDINVMLRGYYQVILNSNVDKGAGFDVDLTYRNSDADKKEASSGGGGAGFFTYVGYVVAGLLVIGLIGAASH